MKPITLHYIKFFLITGFLFGLLTLVIDRMDGKDFNIWGLLFKAAFFGAFMSLAFVTLQIISLKRMGVKNITAEDLKVRQNKSVISTITKEELIQKLKADPYTSKMAIEEYENEIDIKSGMSLWSWGENIKIRVNPTHAHGN